VIGDLSRLSARRYPDKPALMFEDTVLTYRDLDQQSNRLAHGLVAQGVVPGDRVALLAENCLEYAIIAQATAKCGAILVPLNFRLAPPEIAYALGNAEPKLLFIEPEFKDAIDTAFKSLTQRPDLVAVREAESLAGLPSLASLSTGQPATAPDIKIDDESAAIIMYTSGTTGFPKGVLYSHRAYYALFDGLAVECDLEHDEVMHIAMPLFHNAGLNGALNSTLMLGATGVIHRGSFDPEAIFAQIEKYRITFALWVPTMFAIIGQHPAAKKYDLSSLRKVSYGGMSIRPDLLATAQQILKGARFYQVFGSTECGNVTVLRPEDHAERSQYTGREFFNVESRVLTDDGRVPAVGEVGEIAVRADISGMIGYWRNDKATAETIRDGWIYSGDLVRIEPGGYITVVDRKKDMIVSGGENVYPKEVEAAIARHPAVREVAVFGIPDIKYVETVCAAISIKPGMMVTAEEIDAFCLQQLARYKRPRKIDFHDDLPKNASGKVTKPALRAPYWAEQKKAN
jgi:acyl-CoA synthetase (AMP-forming)/AMP-acid ligase II